MCIKRLKRSNTKKPEPRVGCRCCNDWQGKKYRQRLRLKDRANEQTKSNES